MQNVKSHFQILSRLLKTRQPYVNKTCCRWIAPKGGKGLVWRRTPQPRWIKWVANFIWKILDAWTCDCQKKPEFALIWKYSGRYDFGGAIDSLDWETRLNFGLRETIWLMPLEDFLEGKRWARTDLSMIKSLSGFVTQLEESMKEARHDCNNDPIVVSLQTK